MTVSSDLSRVDYIGNGVTAAFPVPYRFLENTHLLVLRTVIATNVSTTLVLDSLGPDGYTVTGAGEPSGGTVTVVTPPTSTERLSILRNVPRTQLTDYIPNDPFPAESHERALDKLTMLVGQLGEVTDRAVVLSPGTAGVSNQLPGPEALKLLRWKPDLSGLENAAPPEIATVADGAVVDATVSPIAGIQGSKLSFLQSGADAYLRTVQDKQRERPSVLDFIPPGEHAAIAAGTSTFDSSAGFNAAIAAHADVLIPAGTYTLLDEVLIPLRHRFLGAGRRNTIINVPATFNLSALGVFRLTNGEPGGEISGISIDFEQPDSAVVGDYTQYPPAVYAQSCPRFKLSEMRISNAWDGIDMKGNSGGAVVDDLELSMFNIGIDIDGSLDSTKLSKIHIWPFAGVGFGALTANQRAVYANAYGIKSVKNDDFHLSDSLIFSVIKGLYLSKGATAVDYTWGQITNTDFDDRGGLWVVDDGRIQISGATFSMGKTDSWFINMTGGTVTVDGARFDVNAINAASNGLIQQSGGTLIIGPTCTLNGRTFDKPLIYAGGGSTSIIGATFSRSEAAFTSPMIHYAGSTGVTANCKVSNKGAGSGSFVTVASDVGVSITDNYTGNWSLSLPATMVNTQLSGNWPVTSTYAPTLTSVANVSSSTSQVCHFSRDTETVRVWGRSDITPTATTTLTEIGISLPPGVVSNFTATHDAVGSAAQQGASSMNVGVVTADVTSDRLRLVFFSTGTSSVAFLWNATLKIK